MSRSLLQIQIDTDLNCRKVEDARERGVDTSIWNDIWTSLMTDKKWLGHIDDRLYHLLPGISSSNLRTFDKRGRYAYAYEKREPDFRKEKKCFEFGKTIHSVLLEDAKLVCDEGFIDELFNPKTGEGYSSPRTTKAYKLWKFNQEEVGGKVMSGLEYSVAHRWVDQCAHHPELTPLFKHPNATKEQAIFAICPKTGLLIKCKPDLFIREQKVMADVKTLSRWGGEWSTKVEKLGYHIQMPHYLYCAEQYYTEKISAFPFICFEKEPPFEVSMKVICKEHLEVGEKILHSSLAGLAKAYEENKWGDGINTNVEISEPSPWFMGKHYGGGA